MHAATMRTLARRRAADAGSDRAMSSFRHVGRATRPTSWPLTMAQVQLGFNH